jgi:hypothetical protein
MGDASASLAGELTKEGKMRLSQGDRVISLYGYGWVKEGDQGTVVATDRYDVNVAWDNGAGRGHSNKEKSCWCLPLDHLKLLVARRAIL